MKSEAKRLFATSDEDRGVQYNFRLGTRANQLLSSGEISTGEKERIDRVIALLKEIGPPNLELYATVHDVVTFFSTTSAKPRYPEVLFDLVNDYKPGRFIREQLVPAYFNN